MQTDLRLSCACAQFGNGTLRLTTRQTYQLHAVLKQDLKTVFSTVIKNMGTTLGACGDVNRNVLAPPAPFKDRPEYVHAAKLAEDIADLFAPQSGAYYDVWLDGEKFVSAQMEVRHPSCINQSVPFMKGSLRDPMGNSESNGIVADRAGDCSALDSLIGLGEDCFVKLGGSAAVHLQVLGSFQ